MSERGTVPGVPLRHAPPASEKTHPPRRIRLAGSAFDRTHREAQSTATFAAASRDRRVTRSALSHFLIVFCVAASAQPYTRLLLKHQGRHTRQTPSERFGESRQKFGAPSPVIAMVWWDGLGAQPEPLVMTKSAYRRAAWDAATRGLQCGVAPPPGGAPRAHARHRAPLRGEDGRGIILVHPSSVAAPRSFSRPRIRMTQSDTRLSDAVPPIRHTTCSAAPLVRHTDTLHLVSECRSVRAAVQVALVCRHVYEGWRDGGRETRTEGHVGACQNSALAPCGARVH